MKVADRQDVVIDSAVVAGLTSLSLSEMNEILAMVGLVIAIPIGIWRFYIAVMEAKIKRKQLEEFEHEHSKSKD